MRHVFALVLGFVILMAVGHVSVASPQSCGTALLVIDVQNAYIPPGGLLAADGFDLVTRLAAILERARASYVPIVYVKQSEARFGGGDPLGDIVTAIAPHEGDPVVWKTTGDAFYQTNLNSILAAMGVHRVLVAGLATHGCVTDTLLGALSGRYETWAVADAHGDAGGPVLETQYNAAWVTWGIHVVASQDIDFAAFECATSATPAGG